MYILSKFQATFGLDVIGVSKYLSVSESTVYRWLNNSKNIPDPCILLMENAIREKENMQEMQRKYNDFKLKIYEICIHEKTKLLESDVTNNSAEDILKQILKVIQYHE